MGNPCFCGCSLQSATKIISIIDIVTFVIYLLITIISGIFAFGKVAKTKHDDASDEALDIVYFSLIFTIDVIFCICSIFLAITLKRGSDKRDLRRCRIWLIITLILFVVSAVSYFSLLHSAPFEKAASSGMVLVYRIFAMWVVYEFTKELKRSAIVSPRGTNQL